MPYILEVQRFGSIKYNGKFEHIGYMSKLFTTKKEAANYYDFHNSHLRKLNTHGTWVSDWDPMTKLILNKKYFFIVAIHLVLLLII